MTDPFVPADRDVRDLDGFMLNVERLLASELVAIGTPDECWAALMLWCRAWKQVPGGSLPNDERILASFSGAGKRWPKVRQVALHGFELCSDGRLYHRFLCAEVERAYAKRIAYRQRREADRERLLKWRAEQRETAGETEGETPGETRFGALETGTGTGTGTGTKKEEGRAHTRASAASYAFEGEIIHLTQNDLTKWRESFSAIEDLDAELRTIDAKFVDEGVDRRKWFGKAAAWLRTRHEKILKDRRSTNGSGFGAPGFA